jgi:hypothetical protein
MEPLAARKSKTEAYTTAGKLFFSSLVYSYTCFATAWVGAAPTGNRKRTVSNVEDTAQASKKAKKGSIPLFMCYFSGLIFL